VVTGLNFGPPVTASPPQLGAWSAADTALAIHTRIVTDFLIVEFENWKACQCPIYETFGMVVTFWNRNIYLKNICSLGCVSTKVFMKSDILKATTTFVLNSLSCIASQVRSYSLPFSKNFHASSFVCGKAMSSGDYPSFRYYARPTDVHETIVIEERSTNRGHPGPVLRSPCPLATWRRKCCKIHCWALDFREEKSSGLLGFKPYLLFSEWYHPLFVGHSPLE